MDSTKLPPPPAPPTPTPDTPVLPIEPAAHKPWATLPVMDIPKPSATITVMADKYFDYASLTLRLGLAFVFTFAAVMMSIFHPDIYINFIPAFARDILPGYWELHLFGIYEIFLALWLLSGKRLLYSAILAAVTLFTIEIFNIQSFDILFRNVAIISAAIALAFISRITKQ